MPTFFIAEDLRKKALRKSGALLAVFKDEFD